MHDCNYPGGREGQSLRIVTSCEGRPGLLVERDHLFNHPSLLTEISIVYFTSTFFYLASKRIRPVVGHSNVETRKTTTHKHRLPQCNYSTDAKQSKALDSLAEAEWQLLPEQAGQGNGNQEEIVLKRSDILINTLLENIRLQNVRYFQNKDFWDLHVFSFRRRTKHPSSTESRPVGNMRLGNALFLLKVIGWCHHISFMDTKHTKNLLRHAFVWTRLKIPS